MIKYIVISIAFYMLGIFTPLLYSTIKISSKCSREEEKRNKKLDYGQIAYNEIKKKEVK